VLKAEDECVSGTESVIRFGFSLIENDPAVCC